MNNKSLKYIVMFYKTMFAIFFFFFYNKFMSYVLDKSWSDILKNKFDENYKINLFSFLNNEYKTKTIFPPQEKIFTALNLVPIDKIKVVIIGQDPYHTFGQADGLAFSCANGTPQPSLTNIKKEIESDLNIKCSPSTDLRPWARQGVLLLNTTLTVEQGKPMSHAKHGWEEFTTKIIELINQIDRPIVFLLWGGHAKRFLKILNNPNHLILQSAHPSPLSAYNGFFGCKHFSKCNEFLLKKGETPIDWSL